MCCAALRSFCCLLLLILGQVSHSHGLLPSKFEGEVFLLQQDGAESQDSSDIATASQLLMYFGRTIYMYQAIGSDRMMQGKYRYARKLAKNGMEVGLLVSEKMFEKGASKSEIVFVPENESIGMYLIRQSGGSTKPSLLIKSGRYTRLTKLFEYFSKKRCDLGKGSALDSSE